MTDRRSAAAEKASLGSSPNQKAAVRAAETQDVIWQRTGPILGVLGGMGPAATADFLLRFTAATPATRDQDHFGTVVYMDPSTPDRSDFLLGSGPDPLPALLRGIDFLDSSGVDMIAIPCNTSHVWHPQLQAASAARILHIVDAVNGQLNDRNPRCSRVGLVATLGTIRSGIYSRVARNGVELLTLEDLSDDPGMAGIRAVKAGDLVEGRALLTDAFEALAERGAECLIAGCTEVSMAFGGSTENLPLPLFDASDALAKEAVKMLQKIRAKRGLIL